MNYMNDQIKKLDEINNKRNNLLANRVVLCKAKSVLLVANSQCNLRLSNYVFRERGWGGGGGGVSVRGGGVLIFSLFMFVTFYFMCYDPNI